MQAIFYAQLGPAIKAVSKQSAKSTSTFVLVLTILLGLAKQVSEPAVGTDCRYWSITRWDNRLCLRQHDLGPRIMHSI